MSKNNKKIILPQEFFPLLEYKHLLLDTSFFGDYSAYPEVFIDFVDSCVKHNITLVTNIPVVTEFCKGCDRPADLPIRRALIKNIIGEYLLPIQPSTFTVEIPWLLERYGQIGKSVSITDFILAAQTKMHYHDLCLLTKNPKDFPRNIFSVKTHLLLQLERELQVYGVLFYGKSEAKQSDHLEPPF